MKTIIKILLMAVLMASPLVSSSQYFQGLYDVDASQDWGYNIFIKPDNSYLIFGTMFVPSVDNWGLFNLQISPGGNSVTAKNYLQLPGTTLICGNPGETRQLASGGFITPLTVNKLSSTYSRGWVGFIKYNAVGDTVFVKTYTDTANFFDGMLCCAVMPDGGYIEGGLHDLNVPSYYPGYIIRTDSFGDTIWTHTYQKYPDQAVYINNINPLPNGQIALGATSKYEQYISGFGNINHYTPWFLIIDSMGTIVKDTIYGARYGGVALKKDLGEGYFNSGELDTLITPDPTDNQNFTDYFARLDTDFSIKWMVTFPYNDYNGHRAQWQIRQLRDSGYIIVGDVVSNNTVRIKGWAAKLNKYGSVVWNQFYLSDNSNDGYLRDVVERPDGGFIFTGQSFNDTLPSWHQHYDMWLIGVDSNGCEDGLCAPAAVPAAPQPVVKSNELLVYPNPTSGVLNFEFSNTGNVTIKLMDITGRLLDKQMISSGTKAVFNVKGYAAGLYMYQVITDGKTQAGKFVVQ